MPPLQLDTLQKTKQALSIIKSDGQIQNYNITLCSIFYFMMMIVDLCFLIYHSNYVKFFIPKIGINLIFMLFNLIFSRRITFFKYNCLLIISKVISILFIALLDQNYIFIMLLIVEENHFILEPWENFIQRIITKIGCLIIISIKLQLADLFIIISVLLLDLIKLIQVILEQKTQKVSRTLSSVQNKYNQELTTICSKEKFCFRIQSLPYCYIIISKKNQSITYKNSASIKKFCTLSEDEFNYLIMKQLNFTILLDHFDNQNNLTAGHHISQKKSFSRKNYEDIHSKKEASEYSFKFNNSEQLTITEILEKLNEERNFESIKVLEIYCQYQQEEYKENKINKQISTFVGQIITNIEDDEIILTLVDISKQSKFYEEKMQEEFKTSIIQSFSHELRTPLNSSCNYLQICLNEKSINEDIKTNFISPAINALRLQSYLINDIIDFSSICADNIELDISNVSVEQIVDEVNKLFKSLLEMKNLILYVDLTENELKTIGTDFSRLVQILVNLLSNSIKYSNAGVILLKLTSQSQNYLKISIKDEGFGIDEERLGQIQKMLQRVEENKSFSNFQTWHGFGLLISQLLLSKLRPIDYKSLLIRSQGHQKGTKVTFYVQNHKLSHQSSGLQSSSLQFKEKNKMMQSKFRVSLSGSNPHVSINGSVIQISELIASNGRANLHQQLSKKCTYKSVRSVENSQLSDSFLNIDRQICEFYNLQPFLFTDKTGQPGKTKQQDCSPQSNRQQPKILSYKQVKMQEDQESEQQLKNVFSKMRCKCRSILSVDDEIFNQKSLQYLLNQYGFEVVLAFNGEEALQVAKETQKCSNNCSLFLIILMDYQMPIMNGLKATINLKKMMDQHLIPQINVVGLTAFNSKKDIEQCFESGMSAVLTKPLIINEFFEILKQL